MMNFVLKMMNFALKSLGAPPRRIDPGARAYSGECIAANFYCNGHRITSRIFSTPGPIGIENALIRTRQPTITQNPAVLRYIRTDLSVGELLFSIENYRKSGHFNRNSHCDAQHWPICHNHFGSILGLLCDTCISAGAGTTCFVQATKIDPNRPK